MMSPPYLETLGRLEYNSSMSSISHNSNENYTSQDFSTYKYIHHHNISTLNSSVPDANFTLQHSNGSTLANELQVQGNNNVSNQNSSNLMSSLFNNSFNLNQNEYDIWNGSQFQQLREGTESSIPSTERSSQDSIGSESGVVLIALLIPLLIAFVAILIVALLIRKMRRGESMRELARQNEESSFYEHRPHSIVFNPKHSLRLPVVLGLEPLDPSELNTSLNESISNSYVNLSNNENEKYENNNINMMRAIPTSKSIVSTGIASRIFYVLNFRQRLRQKKAEKNRFNIYTISLETREQLKQIYVY